MKNNNAFQNLWLFDLVAMLALVFMSGIVLRIQANEEKIIPTISKIVETDTLGLKEMNEQVNTVYNRISNTDTRQKGFEEFENNRDTLQGIYLNSELWTSMVDSTLDPFDRADTIFSYQSKAVDFYQETEVYRNELLEAYLKETKIEKKIFQEDDLRFPSGKSEPDLIQGGKNDKSLEEVLESIYAIVDTFLIMKDYNIVKVIGHTDPVDDELYNRNLSEERADYLAEKIRAHIDNHKEIGPFKPYIVESVGHGEFELLEREEGEKTQDYYKRNRRVEIVFSFQKFDD